MKTKLILCLLLVLGAACSGYAQAANAGQVYSNETYGFQITVPKGWMAKEVGFEQNHYGFAFMTINNQRRDLEFGDGWEEAFGWNWHGKKTQLQTDEVYMVIGYSGGPFPTTMRADTVDHDLGSLLATNLIHGESMEGFSNYGLNFFKRGQWWTIEASMKVPVMAQNYDAVVSMLRSFRFLDGTVGNASWAEALAWSELPQNERAPGSMEGWPSVGEYGRTSEQEGQINDKFVVVKKISDGYSVKFTQGANMVRSWEYTISADGKVMQTTYQHEYRWKLLGGRIGMGVLLLALLAGLLLMERTARISK